MENVWNSPDKLTQVQIGGTRLAYLSLTFMRTSISHWTIKLTNAHHGAGHNTQVEFAFSSYCSLQDHWHDIFSFITQFIKP